MDVHVQGGEQFTIEAAANVELEDLDEMYPYYLLVHTPPTALSAVVGAAPCMLSGSGQAAHVGADERSGSRV